MYKNFKPNLIPNNGDGIQTTGCCCGHNKVKPMINVIPDHHEKMIALGYKYFINRFDVICYKPKVRINNQ